MSLLDQVPSQIAPTMAMRHDLNRRLELGLQKFRNSTLLAQQLESRGYRVAHGLATRGLVVQMVRGHGTKRLGINSDMDALSTLEANTFAHRRTH